MDNHVFYFQDENLNPEKALNGSLKMILGADGLSMLALSAEGEVLGLEAIQLAEKKPDNQYFEFELNEVLADRKLLTYTFGKIQAVISVPMATLVPNRLFSPQECHTYFQLLNPSAADTIFGHEEISNFGCHLVWGASSHFRHYTTRYRPKHLGGALIAGFHQLASQEGFSIFMNVRNNQAHITVFDLRSLVFYNTFEFLKPADLLYFVLLVYDQFRINPEQVSLQVTGALIEGSDHFKMLHKYIQNIAFIAPKMTLSLPKNQNTLPAHYWFDLLSL